MAAASAGLTQEIDNITECSICVDLFRKPKILPCVHTFCCQCLQQYVKGKHTASCPICRKDFVIPAGGIDKLPGNFFIDKLVELRRNQTVPETPTMCDICTEDGETADPNKFAAWNCINCGENLCHQCSRNHQKSKIGRSHNVVKVDTCIGKSQPGSIDRSKIFGTSDEAGEKFRENLQSDMNGIRAVEEQLELEVVRGELEKKKILNNVARIKSLITNKSEELIQLVCSNRDSLVNQLDSTCTRSIQQMDNHTEDMNKQLVMLGAFMRYSEEIKAKATSSMMSTIAPELNARARELQNFTIIKWNTPDISFQPLEILKGVPNMLGVISESYSTAVLVKLTPHKKPADETLTKKEERDNLKTFKAPSKTTSHNDDDVKTTGGRRKNNSYYQQNMMQKLQDDLLQAMTKALETKDSVVSPTTRCGYCKRSGHGLFVQAGDKVKISCRKSDFFDQTFQSIEVFRQRMNIRHVCQQMLDKDDVLESGTDFEITSDGSKLFDRVDNTMLEEPIFEEFENVLDLYEDDFPSSGPKYTSSEASKLYRFIDVLLSTDVMKYCYDNLKQGDHLVGEIKEFRRKLFAIWFSKNDSNICAFQRVFSGVFESRFVKQNTVALHNWVRYYREQRKGRIRYGGLVYAKYNDQSDDDDDDDVVITICFDWRGKPSGESSMFLGTTPAFEVALYTYLFFVGEADVPTKLEFDGQKVNVIICQENQHLMHAYPEEVKKH